MVCTLANISVETYYSTSTFSFHVRYRTESIVVVPHGKWHWWAHRIRDANTPQVESCNHKRWAGNALSTQAPNLPLNPTLPGPSVGGGVLSSNLAFNLFANEPCWPRTFARQCNVRHRGAGSTTIAT